MQLPAPSPSSSAEASASPSIRRPPRTQGQKVLKQYPGGLSRKQVGAMKRLQSADAADRIAHFGSRTEHASGGKLPQFGNSPEKPKESYDLDMRAYDSSDGANSADDAAATGSAPNASQQRSAQGDHRGWVASSSAAGSGSAFAAMFAGGPFSGAAPSQGPSALGGAQPRIDAHMYPPAAAPPNVLGQSPHTQYAVTPNAMSFATNPFVSMESTMMMNMQRAMQMQQQKIWLEQQRWMEQQIRMMQQQQAMQQEQMSAREREREEGADQQRLRDEATTGEHGSFVGGSREKRSDCEAAGAGSSRPSGPSSSSSTSGASGDAGGGQQEAKSQPSFTSIVKSPNRPEPPPDLSIDATPSGQNPTSQPSSPTSFVRRASFQGDTIDRRLGNENFTSRSPRPSGVGKHTRSRRHSFASRRCSLACAVDAVNGSRNLRRLSGAGFAGPHFDVAAVFDALEVGGTSERARQAGMNKNNVRPRAAGTASPTRAPGGVRQRITMTDRDGEEGGISTNTHQEDYGLDPDDEAPFGRSISKDSACGLYEKFLNERTEAAPVGEKSSKRVKHAIATARDPLFASHADLMAHLRGDVFTPPAVVSQLVPPSSPGANQMRPRPPGGATTSPSAPSGGKVDFPGGRRPLTTPGGTRVHTRSKERFAPRWFMPATCGSGGAPAVEQAGLKHLDINGSGPPGTATGRSRGVSPGIRTDTENSAGQMVIGSGLQGKRHEKRPRSGRSREEHAVDQVGTTSQRPSGAKPGRILRPQTGSKSKSAEQQQSTSGADESRSGSKNIPRVTDDEERESSLWHHWFPESLPSRAPSARQSRRRPQSSPQHWTPAGMRRVKGFFSTPRGVADDEEGYSFTTGDPRQGGRPRTTGNAALRGRSVSPGDYDINEELRPRASAREVGAERRAICRQQQRSRGARNHSPFGRDFAVTSVNTPFGATAIASVLGYGPPSIPVPPHLVMEPHTHDNASTRNASSSSMRLINNTTEIVAPSKPGKKTSRRNPHEPSRIILNEEGATLRKLQRKMDQESRQRCTSSNVVDMRRVPSVTDAGPFTPPLTPSGPTRPQETRPDLQKEQTTNAAHQEDPEQATQQMDSPAPRLHESDDAVAQELQVELEQMEQFRLEQKKLPCGAGAASLEETHGSALRADRSLSKSASTLVDGRGERQPSPELTRGAFSTQRGTFRSSVHMQEPVPDDMELLPLPGDEDNDLGIIRERSVASRHNVPPGGSAIVGGHAPGAGPLAHRLLAQEQHGDLLKREEGDSDWVVDDENSLGNPANPSSTSVFVQQANSAPTEGGSDPFVAGRVLNGIVVYRSGPRLFEGTRGAPNVAEQVRKKQLLQAQRFNYKVRPGATESHATAGGAAYSSSLQAEDLPSTKHASPNQRQASFFSSVPLDEYFGLARNENADLSEDNLLRTKVVTGGERSSTAEPNFKKLLKRRRSSSCSWLRRRTASAGSRAPIKFGRQLPRRAPENHVATPAEMLERDLESFFPHVQVAEYEWRTPHQTVSRLTRPSSDLCSKKQARFHIVNDNEGDHCHNRQRHVLKCVVAFQQQSSNTQERKTLLPRPVSSQSFVASRSDRDVEFRFENEKNSGEAVPRTANAPSPSDSKYGTRRQPGTDSTPSPKSSGGKPGLVRRGGGDVDGELRMIKRFEGTQAVVPESKYETRSERAFTSSANHAKAHVIGAPAPSPAKRATTPASLLRRSLQVLCATPATTFSGVPNSSAAEGSTNIKSENRVGETATALTEVSCRAGVADEKQTSCSAATTSFSRGKLIDLMHEDREEAERARLAAGLEELQDQDGGCDGTTTSSQHGGCDQALSTLLEQSSLSPRADADQIKAERSFLLPLRQLNLQSPLMAPATSSMPAQTRAEGRVATTANAQAKRRRVGGTGTPQPEDDDDAATTEPADSSRGGSKDHIATSTYVDQRCSAAIQPCSHGNDASQNKAQTRRSHHRSRNTSSQKHKQRGGTAPTERTEEGTEVKKTGTSTVVFQRPQTEQIAGSILNFEDFFAHEPQEDSRHATTRRNKRKLGEFATTQRNEGHIKRKAGAAADDNNAVAPVKNDLSLRVKPLSNPTRQGKPPAATTSSREKQQHQQLAQTDFGGSDGRCKNEQTCVAVLATNGKHQPQDIKADSSSSSMSARQGNTASSSSRSKQQAPHATSNLPWYHRYMLERAAAQNFRPAETHKWTVTPPGSARAKKRIVNLKLHADATAFGAVAGATEKNTPRLIRNARTAF
ncbi:unnamed protein product [Amoebophrya sp. A25]|nr:unnamed protein product [Amoebophrya sp. A25]|eukprot:GSA25T00007731001.1